MSSTTTGVSDEFRVSTPVGTASGRGAGLTAGEASERADISAVRPPQGLFGPTGEVLMDHEGEDLLVAEEELEVHFGHGDEILDPTGRAEAGHARR